MCGRYVITTPPDAIREAFEIMTELPNAGPSWNVAPTQSAPVVRRHPATGARHLDLLHWGLVPHFERDPKAARKPINARAETVRTLPSFRGAYATRRCLVPADAFYEWRNWRETPDAAEAQREGERPPAKQPFAVARADGAFMALAGLWEGWRGPDGTVLRSFAIVTTDANEALRPLHARMAVIVEPADWPLWLGEADGDPGTLLRPSDAALRIWPVSTRVNSVRNNDAALLDPV
jgi:putative SOS response-associated peptidase YedK